MHLDVNGLITQSDGDGGDKLQREGFWYEGMFFNQAYPPILGMAPYSVAIQYLTDDNGNLQRDEIKYTAILDPNDVSRDQLVPNVISCGLYGYFNRVKTIFSNIIKNFSRYPNNDIAFLIDYSRIFRALRLWWLYPVIFIFDIWFLFSTIITTVLTYFDPTNQNVGNDLNLIADLAQTQHVLPTIFSWAARKFFKWFRKGGPMYGMTVYFNPSTGANPEFIALWQPIVEKF